MPYHVVSRGNNKCCMFEDDTDHLRFLDRLAISLERFAIACVAYCLMWNHFHLVVIPGAHTVSDFMQHLNGAYCGGFNRRHRRVGHLVQGRPSMTIVDTDAYLLTAVRYVLRNPVEAKKAGTPGDWRWSSYAALWSDDCPPFLSFDSVWQALDTSTAEIGRERLKTFLAAETVSQGIHDLENSLLIGSEGVGGRVDPLLPPARKNREIPLAERHATRPRLEYFFDDVHSQAEVEDAAREAFCRHAYKLREIGAVIGRPSSTVWTWIQRAAGRTPGPVGTSGPRSRRRYASGVISVFE